MSPRNKLFRKLGSPPVLKGFKPIGIPCNETNVVSVLYEEYEALRLADYSGLKQEEASKLMNISRPTFTRIYSSCLQKIARAFAEGASIVIEGGDVEFDKQWYRCNDCASVFHHVDDAKDECISCESEDIEHINKSLRDWKSRQFGTRGKFDLQESCVCPNCEYEKAHQRGIPCYSMTCPDCRVPLRRKSI